MFERKRCATHRDMTGYIPNVEPRDRCLVQKLLRDGEDLAGGAAFLASVAPNCVQEHILAVHSGWAAR